LAKLPFNEESKEEIIKDLDNILTFVEKLKEPDPLMLKRLLISQMKMFLERTKQSRKLQKTRRLKMLLLKTLIISK